MKAKTMLQISCVILAVPVLILVFFSLRYSPDDMTILLFSYSWMFWPYSIMLFITIRHFINNNISFLKADMHSNIIISLLSVIFYIWTRLNPQQIGIAFILTPIPQIILYLIINYFLRTSVK